MRPKDQHLPQPDKFRDLARELECDEDEARFEQAVRQVVKDGREPKPAPAKS